MANLNEHLQRYEKELETARILFANKVKTLMQEQDPRKLLIFWLNFSSLGIEMTEPVEDWIRRAGEKSKSLGYETLGIKLIKHARHEKDHHHMMIEDTKKLVQFWNKAYTPFLTESLLINRPLADSVKSYQDLHENCINSQFPFAQIAIEYEIENLSVVHGPVLINNSISTFGEGIRSCLSFVRDHAEIDQAHTVYNQNAIAEFVQEYPTTVDKLIETGNRALNIYAAFLNHCYETRDIFVATALAV